MTDSHKIIAHYSITSDSSGDLSFFNVLSKINRVLPEWAKVIRANRGRSGSANPEYYLHLTILAEMQGKKLFQYKLSNEMPDRVKILEEVLKEVGIPSGCRYEFSTKELRK